jgi:hypothetical protein
MMKKLVFLLLLVLPLIAACGGIGIRQNPEGGVDIDISLTEAQVNDLLGQAITAAQEEGRDLRARNVTIDLQAGQIVISGEFEVQEGSGNYVPGTITVSVGMVDGQANVEVTSVNIQGIEARDERIARINERIEQALNARAAEGQNSARLTNIQVTDTNLTLTINVQQGE